MKQARSILFPLAVFLLLLVSPTFLYADWAEQVDTAGESAPLDPALLASEIPPLEGGATYPHPIISYAAPAQAGPAAVDTPTIDVWYGTTQNFGQRGTPQTWINILGTVGGPLPVTSLKYSLNGGPDKTLSIGGSVARERLYNTGDFNIELPFIDLNDGANTVVIKASDGTAQATQTVTVNYDAGNTWPLPYTTNWSSLPAESWMQPVDGKWQAVGGRLETVAPGYDRLVAIGDIAWGDYEVTVPVTVKSLNTAEWGPPSNGAGVGIMVHWRGHYDNKTGAQPLAGWRRFGGLAWYRWNTNGGAAFELLGNGGKDLIPPKSDKSIALDTPYIFKMSVQASTLAGEPATYRFKFWEVGQPEPPAWYMTSAGNLGEPPSGSVLLVAHQAMVSFGDVAVTPITSETFTINVEDPTNGSIVVTPQKEAYAYGERVELRAVGDTGYGLTSWTGDFSGTQNPIVFDITENVTVGGVFAPLTEEIRLNVTANAGGTVNVVPKRIRFGYGEVARLTPQPNPGYIFAGWSGDLLGADNPATIVMDRTKNITANFVPANTQSPVSDDFNACALNTGLWTFVNPLGVGSQRLNGTQLLLTVPANTSHNIWDNGNLSVRVVQPTQNVDFEIVTKFESVVSQRYQMQGILVEQDAENFLRFEVHHDGTNIRLFAARFLDGEPKAIITGISLPATPPYLRVTRVGSLWSFSHSSDGATWTAGGSFNFTLNVTKTGVFAANHGTPPARPAPEHTVIVDYFFNSAAPIVPEDGDPIGPFTIAVQKQGEGAVTLNPAKATYACNEVVTVTAAPAAGWTFAGWGGDLTGAAPTQQLIVSKNHQITAVFTRGAGSFKIFLPSVRR